MERYSDKAIEIINELHKDRIDYESEYIPLIDCANQCSAYEDTGMTPEEIAKIGMETEAGCVRAIARMYGVNINRLRELAEADRDERVVVLPCKVGDTVYRLQYIEPALGRFTVGVKPIKFALFWLEEFGKTVFLTREEAEEALEAMKNG